ncbi:antitoxin of the ChpA-ChpR toxin-antitoxin system [Candidatus Sulfopaludibacter sp. SbA4]|nr:antitoxin of the ChpA-ChpR toxin-antitoxin system [Candidatus Sulfopaludibacter sp. SbA4]
MKVSVQRWGNSLAVRIPKAVAVESELAEGDVVDMKPAKGKVVLIPVRDRKPTLEELLAGVTEENIHREVDFGKPKGKEVW